jgi:rubrerythrin
MSTSNLVVPALARVDVKGMTRSSFLLRSTLAAGAVYGGSVVAPYVTQALAQDESGGDIDTLNFALTLEYLEATFYQEALRQVGGLSGEVSALAEEIESNESEHVDALSKAIEDLDGKPVKAPVFDFGDAYQDEDSFLELAQDLEDTGVSAYNGAAPTIQSEEVLAVAASIVQVEGRHAALVRLQRGEEPAPVAFDETLSEQEVLDAVQPYMEGGG